MNLVERKVYNFVKNFPRLKYFIVRTYQIIFSLIPGRRVITKNEIIVREGYFYGFHDKSPWSHDNQFLLAHHFKMKNRLPNIEDTLDIGIFQGDSWKTFFPIAKTNAWNWQMGSMLQWVGNTDNFIFNDYDGEKHISRMFNIQGQELITFSVPISAISRNGMYAVSHSFNRQKSQLGPKAYGYATGKDANESENVSSNEFLKIINIKTQVITNLISLSKIVEYKHTLEMNDAYHYFTHCLFSPDSRKLLFIHRWLNKKNQEFSRLFSINISEGTLYLFPTSGMVSHITWRNDNEVLAYCEVEKKEQYYLLENLTGRYRLLDTNQFSENGHPSYSKGDLLLTDTYPNRSRYQSLLVYSETKKQLTTIAKLKAPQSFVGGIKCDLHPRWNRTGEYICFDSAHTGTRSLCTVRLEK